MVDEYLNTKGSIWRKWDLHIHTPGTRLNDQFKEGWESYIQEIEKSDVSVIGITDYLSVNNYFKVKNYKEKENRLENIDLILPNIELRLKDATDSERGINFHIIFSSEVDSYIDSHFLSKLTFRYGERTYHAIDRDLIDLGRQFKECVSDQEALVEGFNQFKVDINEINGILETNQKQIFHGKYVTAAANKQTDGVSGIRDNQFRGVKENIYKKTHMIFSSRPGDRSYFLKEDTIGGPKPCIHGSDAHRLDKLFKPDEERYTWIKADPTFVGLLQILTEPERRVRIQKDFPETKLNYNVIDKVIFKDSNENFQQHDIHFNSGLNTIIGGKSSGKSLLLYKIASTISPQEIDLRTKNDIWNNNYVNSFIDNIEFEVHWKTGDVANSKKENHIGNITYIPQLYINSLSEDTKNDVLQEKIWDILKNDSDIKSRMENTLEIERNYKELINSLSFQLATELESHKKLNLKINEYQKLEIYTGEQRNLNDAMQKELEESKMTTEDELLHQQLNAQFVSLMNYITEEGNTLTELNAIIDMINGTSNIINGKFSDIILSKEWLNSLIENYKSQFKDLIRVMVIELKEKIDESIENKTIHEEMLKEIQQKIVSLENQYTKETKVDEIREKIMLNDKNIKNLTELLAEEEDIVSRIEKLKRDLISNLEVIFKNQHELVSEISDKDVGSLKVKAKLLFNQKEFHDIFIAHFNLQKSLSKSIPHELVDEDRKFIFDEESYLRNTNKILEIVLNLPEERYKKGFDLSRIIEDTFRIYTKVILDIEKDNDTISVMSPGKRGLVLLELFLSISDEKHPILIDQPEDNLDNRTISTDLVSFIRKKSIERQIIIVTHNANIVVLTDSENVLIANQDATKIENESCRFEYISGSLECNFLIKGSKKIYAKGIRNHACDILEGGPDAFALREQKYGFK